MTLRIFDTPRGEKRPFEPLEPGKVRLYVCGVTPYDRCHIGHARVYIVWDVVYRYLKSCGYQVTYVRNFTDVDDKIIARANERGMEPVALAQENIEAFHAEMDALGIARPDHEPRVSTSIDAIIGLVRRLEERGLAYNVDGDVYYAVEAFKDYGKLSGRSLEDMQAGARVEVDPRKRHPMDFALWKSAKPGEPSWESPWGKGRPGWHIECSAMSMATLGETLDIHAGGSDLIFPHHENETAQSEGATGVEFVRYWMHNGFVNIDDTKMSKSLGNVFNTCDVLRRYEPQVLRFFMLGTHYRNPISFSDRSLDEAAARVAYFYESLRKANAYVDDAVDQEPTDGALPGQAFIEQVDAAFADAMEDDFNTVRVIALLGEIFKHLNELAVTRKKKLRPAAVAAVRRLLPAVRRIDAVLKMLGEDPREYLVRHRMKAALRRELSLDWIVEHVEARLAARAEKDWGRADALRDDLASKGVVLMDGPTGTDWAVSDVAPEEEQATA